MRKLDNEQAQAVRDLIYRYCEVQKTMSEAYPSALDACLKYNWIEIYKQEGLLGLRSEDEK
jgi:hypothetical protein